MEYNDPYKTLGVSRDSDDETIKKAYRNLVRKYHPDRYTDEGMAEIATEKMKSINAAYDQIQKERAAAKEAGSSSGGSGFGYGYNGAFGGRYGTEDYGNGYSWGGESTYEGDASYDPRYAQVRRLINERREVEADRILMTIPSDERDAEWYFLRGCVLVRNGNYFDAGRCFDIAVSMAPDNSEYRTARETLRRRTAGTAQGETQQYYGCCSSDGCCDCMRMCCFMRFCC